MELEDVRYSVTWKHEKTSVPLYNFFNFSEIDCCMLAPEAIFQGQRVPNPFSTGARPRTRLKKFTTFLRPHIVVCGGDTSVWYMS